MKCELEDEGTNRTKKEEHQEKANFQRKGSLTRGHSPGDRKDEEKANQVLVMHEENTMHRKTDVEREKAGLSLRRRTGSVSGTAGRRSATDTTIASSGTTTR